MKWRYYLLRLLLAAFFLFSALSKLQDIDLFEIYIYQLGIFDFVLSSWIARLIISFELYLGVGFLSGLHLKTFCKLGTIGILSFSVFHLYNIFFREEANCFCFGELINIPSEQSLMLNFVVLIFIFLVRRRPSQSGKWFRLSHAIMLAIALITSVIVSPPDHLISKGFSESEVDRKALQEIIDNNLLPVELSHGKQVLCFYSTNCKFCRLSSSKIGAAFRRHDIPVMRHHAIFMDDSADNIEEFVKETAGVRSNDYFLARGPFLKITKGRMPLIVLLQDGRIVEKWHYRSIDENRLEQFFQEVRI